MAESKVKIDVANLATGMYVCELDRPWLESPFLFQGFPLDNEDIIQQLQDLCEYVYVDPERSATSIRSKLLTRSSKDTSPNKSVFTAKPRSNGGDITDNIIDYREHLQLARKIHTRARSFISEMQSFVRDGGENIDVQGAQTLVSDMADNIMVNPHAMMWLTYLKQRHEYTMTHSVNVCILALTFGRHLKLERETLEILGLGALLHDIGKLRIPSEILDKPGRLTPDEFEVMKKHPSEGFSILKDDKYIHPDALEIVHHHHERISGTGYPDRLDSESINFLTKVVSIVDVYDAITSDRCYHDGISPYKALQNIYKWAEAQFDKKLVEEFMSCMGVYPIGSIVELNNQRIGIVISTTPKTRLRPIVLLVMDEKHEMCDIRRILNLSTQSWDKENERLEINKIVEPAEVGIKVREVLEQESLSPA
jgi:putative nucleotidyltransferase with HDIG domain